MTKITKAASIQGRLLPRSMKMLLDLNYLKHASLAVCRDRHKPSAYWNAQLLGLPFVNFKQTEPFSLNGAGGYSKELPSSQLGWPVHQAAEQRACTAGIPQLEWEPDPLSTTQPLSTELAMSLHNFPGSALPRVMYHMNLQPLPQVPDNWEEVTRVFVINMDAYSVRNPGRPKIISYSSVSISRGRAARRKTMISDSIDFPTASWLEEQILILFHFWIRNIFTFVHTQWIWLRSTLSAKCWTLLAVHRGLVKSGGRAGFICLQTLTNNNVLQKRTSVPSNIVNRL